MPWQIYLHLGTRYGNSSTKATDLEILGTETHDVNAISRVKQDNNDSDKGENTLTRLISKSYYCLGKT